MREKKYVVPQGMLDAAYQYCPASFAMPAVRSMLESSLRWLSENPVVPTVEESKELWRTSGAAVELTESKRASIYATEWQRRMFLVEEDRVPEEIKDMLLGISEELNPTVTGNEHNAAVIEAYRRGQKSKEKSNDPPRL